MAGQKLKKQERYKEEQIKRKAIHISTEEITTTNKTFFTFRKEFTTLEFLPKSKDNHTSPENFNE